MHPRRRFSVPLADGRTLALGERTLIMGIINVTPDSFSDGGAALDPYELARVSDHTTPVDRRNEPCLLRRVSR